MKKYTLVFSIAYLVFGLVFFAVAELLKINANASFSVATTLASSFLAAWKFAKDHGREPTIEEKKSYAWQALLSVWVISLILAIVMFAAFLSPSEAKGVLTVMGTWQTTYLVIGLGISVFVSLVYYVAIRWSFAWFAKLTCR
ncbi:MAG: ABZJ_00895 family protein [Hylemonella sp.]|nr:ABZJ_00895 family protein [Hylemonella sp.]